MRRLFTAARVGSISGARARTLRVTFSSSAVSVLLLASAAQATVSTTPEVFTDGEWSKNACTATTIEGNPSTVWLSSVEPSPTAAGRETSCGGITLSDVAGPAPYPRGAANFNDVAPPINSDLADNFNVDPGPIPERGATADINQIAFGAANANPSFAGRDFLTQSGAALDLAANGLGPTKVVKRGRRRFDNGLDFSLLSVFLFLLVGALAGLALARRKLS